MADGNLLHGIEPVSGGRPVDRLVAAQVRLVVVPTCEGENTGMIDWVLCGITGFIDRMLVSFPEMSIEQARNKALEFINKVQMGEDEIQGEEIVFLEGGKKVKINNVKIQSKEIK